MTGHWVSLKSAQAFNSFLIPLKSSVGPGLGEHWSVIHLSLPSQWSLQQLGALPSHKGGRRRQRLRSLSISYTCNFFCGGNRAGDNIQERGSQPALFLIPSDPRLKDTVRRSWDLISLILPCSEQEHAQLCHREKYKLDAMRFTVPGRRADRRSEHCFAFQKKRWRRGCFGLLLDPASHWH